MAIRLIAGLGNPGPRYADTRHNVGAWFVERLARRFSIAPAADTKFKGEVGRGDETAGMMARCDQVYEERLKANYLCPCTFFGVVQYTIIDGRLDEAVTRADQWLSNGDSMSFLPHNVIFAKLKDRPEYADLLARNEEQLERQRQIYFAGRDKTTAALSP